MPGCSVRWPRPLELAPRLLLACALLLWAAHAWGRTLVDLLLPALRAAFLSLDDHYRILQLNTGSAGADSVIRLRVNLAQPMVVGGRVVVPHPLGAAEVTTAIGYVMQPLIIGLTLVLAWPWRTRAELAVRLVMAGALLVLALWLDTPFVLWANLWDMHARALEPERFSPLLAWAQWLQGGGRLLLGGVAGTLAIIGGKAAC